MKIEKNPFLSCTSQPLAHQGRLYQSLTIGLGFDLVQSEVLPADQAWAAAIENVPESWCIDSGLPKKHAEWLLAGSARTAGGKLQSEMLVEMEVGVSRRSFSICGHYQENGTVPLFSAMPLIWEHTFGHPKSSGNPLGHGELANPNGRVYLPEVRDAQDAAGVPACPGPRGAWPCRMRNMGTYDGAWLGHRWPGLPDDCDWSFCNLAQPAQHIPAGLRGDETLRLTGLHHEHPVLSSRLPGKSLRVFVEYADAERALRVLPALDTLWLFPDALTGLLLWHALILGKDECATDIETLRLEMDPAEPDPLINTPEERQALHDSSAAEWRRPGHFAAGRGMPPVPAAESETVGQAFTDALEALEGVLEQPEGGALSGELWGPGVDLSGQDLAGRDFSGIDFSGADFSGAKLMRARFAGSILRNVDFSGADMAGADLSRADLAGAALPGVNLVGGILCGASAPEAVFIEADLSLADMHGLHAAGADFTGCVMEGAMLRQADCSGANFTGVKAAGLDAQGADCGKAALRGGTFSNAIFTDASLRESDMSASIFDAAVFQRADCGKTSFGGAATARNCDFSQAILAEAEWEGVQAEGSIFTQAQANGARFIACGFTRTSWQASLAVGADFSRSALCGADMRQANLLKASFRESALQGADCTGANLYGADFYRCAFDAATRMQGALLGNTVLRLAEQG